MSKKYSISPIWLVFFTVVLLSNCSKAVENKPEPMRQAASPFSLPMETYMALAASSHGDEKQDYLLMAAGRALYHGSAESSAGILAQTGQLNAIQTDKKNILLAKTHLQQATPDEAIKVLSEVRSPRSLPLFYRIQYHEILALAYESRAMHSLAVSERVKLQALLPNDSGFEDNQRKLWVSLTRLPDAELQSLAEDGKDPSLKGWTSLALITREPKRKETSLTDVLYKWQKNFPSHEANGLLRAGSERMIEESPAVAVLLPLTGPLSGPGTAVRDGFMAGWQAYASRNEVQVLFYDTGREDAAELYQQALKAGAQYVVGPLTKADASKVATLEHPVPTLLLNELGQASDKNLYKFGLSPAQEAREAAVEARKKSLSRALIMAPDTPWGKEISDAFRTEFKSRGGEIIDELVMQDDMDLTTGLRKFLHVQERKLPEVKGQASKIPKKQIEITRREDFDMIFLLAYPSRARQVMPLIKYYFAGNVPVYATSSVYAGTENKMRDKDLDGIIFCDMPWVFSEHLANRNWPEQFNSYNRLYALGMESFALSMEFNKLLIFPAVSLAKSGVLYLSQDRHVVRELAWGRFKKGIAEKIEV